MMRLVVDTHQNDDIVHQNDEVTMRTTLTIPDPFYQRVKKALPEKGYTSINSYLLDLLRHQIDVPSHQNGAKTHQNDAPQIQVKQKDKAVPVKKPGTKELNEMCEHGYLGKLCTHEKCRKKYAN